MLRQCSNCEKPLNPEDKFCANCGQSTLSFDTGFWVVLKSQVHELLDIDGRMFRTLKILLTQPGELSRAFNAGQRVSYSPPLRLYLAISILFFLLFAYVGPVYSSGEAAPESTSDYYARAMFVLFPIFALLVHVLFQGSRFIGNLVFSLHIHTLVYLVLMVIAPLEANETRHIALMWLQIPPSLYLGWYYFMAFKRVFEQSWLLTIIKSGAIFIVYMALLGIAFDVVLTNLAN